MNEHELLVAVADAAETVLRRLLFKHDGNQDTMALQQKLDTLRAFQEHANEADRPAVRVRSQVCKYCEAMFFFARLDDPDDDFDSPVALVNRPRWIPLELDPIDSDQVLPDWRWVVDFRAQPPTTHINPDATQVYVDHRQTCARNEDGPKRKCAPYVRRWKVNSTKIHAETENESIRATNDLLALQRRLVDTQEHDDS